METSVNLQEFAKTEEEAVERAQKFLDADPFLSIEPALLSSAEIEDYARVTGMIHAFRTANMKSSSYGAAIHGDHLLWLPNNDRLEKRPIDSQTPCRLPANSISFVEIEPKFHLPNYIGLRFNLAITHVHRGLLLGTGPLIDPGFWGRILIPIHNLTESDYTIPGGDILVWFEFTKTTYGRLNSSGQADQAQRIAKATLFPPRKKGVTPEYYLERASHGQPIRNSIPQAIRNAETAAVDAKDSAADSKRSALEMRRNVTIAGVAAAVAAMVSLVTVFVQVHGIVLDAHTLNQSVLSGLTSSVTDSKLLGDKIQSLEQKLKDTEAEQARERRSMQERLADQVAGLKEQLGLLQMNVQLLQHQQR